MRIARERNDIEEITRAYVNLGETLDWAGRIEEAADLAGEGALSAIEQGISPLAALLASDQALRLLRLGRWDDADAALAIAIDAAISGVTAGAALAGRALLDALRGRFDESRTPSTRPSARRRTPWGRCGRGRWPSRAPSSRSGAGARTTRATPSWPCSTASSRPTRTPSTSRPSSPSERAPPPTSPSRPAPPATREAEREAGAFAATLVERARHLVRPEAFPPAAARPRRC